MYNRGGNENVTKTFWYKGFGKVASLSRIGGGLL